MAGRKTVRPSGRKRKGLSLIFALLLVFSTLGFLSCDRNLPQDKELVDAAAALIEKSLVLDRLFFIEGIPYIGDDSEAYREADKAAISALGFSSYADIKSYAARYYSVALLRDFESLSVEAQTQDNQLICRAYCYDKLDDDGRFVSLMVSTGGVHRQTDEVTYDMSTLCVTEKSRNSAQLSVSVTITSQKTGESQTKQKRISLVLEDEWKLDALTCMTYYTMPTD